MHMTYCDGKKGYLDKRGALLVLREVQRRARAKHYRGNVARPGTVMVYRCPGCGLWHLGRRYGS